MLDRDSDSRVAVGVYCTSYFINSFFTLYFIPNTNCHRGVPDLPCLSNRGGRHLPVSLACCARIHEADNFKFKFERNDNVPLSFPTHVLHIYPCLQLLIWHLVWRYPWYLQLCLPVLHPYVCDRTPTIGPVTDPYKVVEIWQQLREQLWSHNRTWTGALGPSDAMLVFSDPCETDLTLDLT